MVFIIVENLVKIDAVVLILKVSIVGECGLKMNIRVPKIGVI